MVMKKKSARAQVIQDEVDAEVAYQTYLMHTANAARTLAQDAARTEAQRLAAAEAETALHRIEEARLKAQHEQAPEVKKTFWGHVTSFLTGY